MQFLAPVLRLADNLDRHQDQRVKELECIIRPDEVRLKLRGDRDVDLEAWAADSAGEVFQQVYGRPLVVVWN